jgi:hypothetical protein
MAKFVTIPTQAVGQPNILFNTDNIMTVIPPTPGVTSGAGLYVRVISQDKEFRLTFGGATGAAQNTNALAGANIINDAITSANAAPINYPVVFPSVTLIAGAGATGQTTITVASTVGLSAGMVVTVVGGDGAFATNTTISSITNSTQFVVSAAPTTTLAGATISAAVLTITTIAVA